MNITVGGIGKIGRVLCEDLVSEGHNLTIIDTKDTIIEQMINRYDLTGLVGSITSIDQQLEANVADCDIFVATTPSDEINLTAAIIARRLGATHTVARVRDPEYASHLSFMRNSLGISRLVNPEYESARAIAEMIQFPSAYAIERFIHGKVILIEGIIQPGSRLIGMDLIHFRADYPNLIVTAIMRGEEVHIPRGSMVLQEGDRVQLTGERALLWQIYPEISQFNGTIDSVLIIGGGRIAYYLLQILQRSHFGVTLVERDATVAEHLAGEFPDVRVIVGDGTDYSTLSELDIASFDILVSLTGMDEGNIMISLYAARQRVPRIVAKVNRTEMLEMFQDQGLQTTITPKRIAADIVLRYVRGLVHSQNTNMEALHHLMNGAVEALEFTIKKEGAMVGVPLRDLKFKPDTLIALVYRQGRIIFPGGSDTLDVHDRIVMVTRQKHVHDMVDVLA